MGWVTLKARRYGAHADVAGVDPNLAWADATRFLDFGGSPRRQPAQIPVLVEFQPSRRPGDDPLHEFERELEKRKAGSVPKAYTKTKGVRYCTALIDAAYCKAVLGASPSRPGKMIRRFELQLPVVPQRPRNREAVDAPAAAAGPRERSNTATLIGVIDSGCPFASWQLRDKSGTGTRLLNIWDQDNLAPAFTRSGGGVPSDFAYGCEIPRAGLNEIMKARTVDGVVDEDACYAASGDLQMRERFQHGAAVLGLLAGPQKLGARRERAPGLPPSWKRANDRASKSDIVFVQMPRDAVQDSSSASLSRHLLDGLRYIVSCAGKKTKRIVVNLSDGTSRGTHDGESIIEQAMEAMVEELRHKRLTLQIVLSAGNSHAESRHAQFDSLPAGPARSVVMRLSPGGEAPSYVFVRLPAGTPRFRIRLTPPAGRPSPWTEAGKAIGLSSASTPSAGIVFPAGSRSAARIALLAFGPTVSHNRHQPVAPAGDWLIEVQALSACRKPVHLYIARNQRNPGALQRGQQARFIDTEGDYDPDRALRYSEADPPQATSPLRREGSVSGLTTGDAGRGVFCVAGYRLHDGAPTLYSSAGPAAGGARRGPDLAGASDESRALVGVRTAGCRSGETVRAVGTSFAAPQVARALANGPILKLKRPPTARNPQRSGKGNLPP